MGALISALFSAAGKTLAGAARWVWTHRRWTLPVLVPALALVLVLGWTAWHYRAQAIQAEQDRRAEDQRQAREAELERRGYLVARAAAQAEAEKAAAELEAKSKELAEQRARAAKELGKLQTKLAAALAGQPSPISDDVTAGEPIALGADLEVVEEKAGAGVVLGTLFADRVSDGKRLVTQPLRRDATWVVTARKECPAAPEPPRTSVYGLLGGTANSAGATYQGGAQVTHRRWAGAALVGPDPAGAGLTITVAGGFRFFSF